MQNILFIVVYRLGDYSTEELQSTFYCYSLGIFVLCFMLQRLKPIFAEMLKKALKQPNNQE